MTSASRSLEQLLDDVAARTPAPAGGSSAAWTAALAGALVEMAAAFAQADDVQHRAADLRADALKLADLELRAYAPVLDALRLPRDDPDRAAQLRSALSSAAESPLALATVGAELAEMAATLVKTGNPNLEGDAVAAALLAEAVARAAARLVEINLANTPDDPRLANAASLAERAGKARAQALSNSRGS